MWFTWNTVRAVVFILKSIENLKPLYQVNGVFCFQNCGCEELSTLGSVS